MFEFNILFEFFLSVCEIELSVVDPFLLKYVANILNGIDFVELLELEGVVLDPLEVLVELRSFCNRCQRSNL